MVADHGSPSSRSSFDASDSNTRKRVCKACDRCRLKKSKCDGSSPCSRCKADNAICQFGERKKSHDKVYPKGYVELLEQHFTQLTAGLRELYRRLQEGEDWPGAALALQRDGHPLTHDILQRLDVLHQSSDCSIPFDGFEESPDRVLDLLHRKHSQSSTRTNSLSPVDDEPPSPTAHTQLRHHHQLMFADPFTHQQHKPAKSNAYAPQRFPSAPNSNTKAVAFAPLAPSAGVEPMIVDSPLDDALLRGDFSSFSSVDVDFSSLQGVGGMPFLSGATTTTTTTNFTYPPATQQHWQQQQQQSSSSLAPSQQAQPPPVSPQPINWDSWLATA